MAKKKTSMPDAPNQAKFGYWGSRELAMFRDYHWLLKQQCHEGLLLKGNMQGGDKVEVDYHALCQILAFLERRDKDFEALYEVMNVVSKLSLPDKH